MTAADIGIMVGYLVSLYAMGFGGGYSLRVFADAVSAAAG